MPKTKLAIYILLLATNCFAYANAVGATDPEALAKKVMCHTCLADIYAKQANIPQAIAEYQELLKLTPNDASAHFKYANLLATNNKPDLAVPQFKLAAKLKPTVPEYQVGLGNTLMYTKDYSGAVAAYTKACLLGGKYQDLLQKAQQYDIQKKQYEQYQKKIQLQKEGDE